MHAVEKLIILSDDTVPLSEEALGILLNLPAIKYLEKESIRSYVNNLKTLFSGRAALNDTLYWTSIERERAVRLEKGEVLDDDCPVACHEHYWAFDVNSFARLVNHMVNRTLQDDKLIALRRAVHVYTQANKPPQLLSSLQEAVAANQPLREELELLLNPSIPENVRQYHTNHQERTLRLEQTRLQREQERRTWITELQTNPDLIHNFNGVNQVEITSDLYWLMVELGDIRSADSFCDYANWELLIPELVAPLRVV